LGCTFLVVKSMQKKHRRVAWSGKGWHNKLLHHGG
jgi:hypothetical protein